jgi:hypothetical protein
MIYSVIIEREKKRGAMVPLVRVGLIMGHGKERK